MTQNRFLFEKETFIKLKTLFGQKGFVIDRKELEGKAVYLILRECIETKENVKEWWLEAALESM
jgi:hypothetical protein